MMLAKFVKRIRIVKCDTYDLLKFYTKAPLSKMIEIKVKSDTSQFFIEHNFPDIKYSYEKDTEFLCKEIL